MVCPAAYVWVADSNAILTYLALRYGAEHWFPREPLRKRGLKTLCSDCLEMSTIA